MSFSPDGKTLALPKPYDGRVELWSLETKKMHSLVSSFDKDGARAYDVAFSKDGRFLATSYFETGVAVWELRAKKEQFTIPVGQADLDQCDGVHC